MNEPLQSGQHPDADQLSAFVEHALPPHEQQKTLAHLAVCPDCRAVVSLSTPPLEESPDPKPESVRKPWFSGWHLALPAAAAFAALVVIVHIRNAASIKSSATTTQMAVSRPPEPGAPLLGSSSSSSEQSPPIASKTEQANPRPASSTGAPDLLKSQVGEGLAGPQPITRPPLEGRNYTDSAQNKPTASNGFAQKQGSTSVAAAGGAALQTPATVALDRLQQNAPGTLQINPPSQASSTTTSPGQQGVAAAKSSPAQPTVDAANQTVEVTSANPVATVPSTNDLVLNETKIVAESPLPSHLPKISTVSTGHQILAIDTHNTLFLSDDGGRHWKTVPPQWPGRAVKVGLAPSIRGRSYAMGGIGGTPSAAGAVGGPVAAPAPVAPLPSNASSVMGTVTDPSGAVIADASIVVSDATAQIVRSAKTDHTGHYVVDDLTPGSYQVEAQAPGFARQQLAITLAASQHGQANLVMSLGQAAETVTVNASAMSLTVQSPARKKTAAPQSVGQPLPVFEITTDAGERWTSADGHIWKHQ
jgi:hypothetical protein